MWGIFQQCLHRQLCGVSLRWQQIKCELVSTFRKVGVLTADCFDLEDVFGVREFCEQKFVNKTMDQPANIEEAVTVPNRAAVCSDPGASWPLLIGSFIAGCFLIVVVAFIVRYYCSFHGKIRKEADDLCSPSPDSRQNQFALMSNEHLPSTVSEDSGIGNARAGTGTSSSPGERSPATTPFGMYPEGLTGPGSEGFYASTQLNTIYSAPSESSSRDYQSIQGNNYITSSDSDSYFKGIKLHRVTLIHGDTANSERSEDDYSICKYRKLHGGNIPVYYPTSECSYKDYMSLNSDRESATYCDIDIELGRDQLEYLLCQNGNQCNTGSSNVKFCVRGMVFPRKQQSCCPISDLTNINEYEAMGSKDSNHDYSGIVGAVGGMVSEHQHGSKGAESDVIIDPDYHDYDLCSDCDVITQKHDYHILEPTK